MKLHRGLVIGLVILIIIVPVSQKSVADDLQEVNRAVLSEAEKTIQSENVYLSQSDWIINKDSLGPNLDLLVVKVSPDSKGPSIGWIPTSSTVITSAAPKDFSQSKQGWKYIKYLYFPNTPQCQVEFEPTQSSFREILKDKYEMYFLNSHKDATRPEAAESIRQFLKTQSVREHSAGILNSPEWRGLKELKCFVTGEGWVPEKNITKIEKMKSVPKVTKWGESKNQICSDDCGGLAPKKNIQRAKNSVSEVVKKFQESKDPSALERFMGDFSQFKDYFVKTEKLVGECELPIRSPARYQNNAVVYLANRVKEMRKTEAGKFPPYWDDKGLRHDITEEDQIALDLLTRVIWAEMGVCGFVTARSDVRETFRDENGKWMSRGSNVGFNPQYFRAAGRIILNRTEGLSAENPRQENISNYAGSFRNKTDPTLASDETLAKLLTVPPRQISKAQATLLALLNKNAFSPLDHQEIGEMGSKREEMNRILCPLDKTHVAILENDFNLQNAKETAYEIYFQSEKFKSSTEMLANYDGFTSKGFRLPGAKEFENSTRLAVNGDPIDNTRCFKAWKLNPPPLKSPQRGHRVRRPSK